VRSSSFPRLLLVALAALLAACSAPAAAPPAKPAAAAPTATSSAPAAAPSSASVAPAQPAAREPVPWTMGRIGNATFHSPFYIAINKGFLREQGLAPELVVLPTPEQIAGLVSGSLNISMSSTDATALAVARGQPLRQVMGYQSKWPYNLVAQPQYTRPEDLKGTTVGVEAINISTGRMTELFLRKYGLERGRDYEVAVSGNNLERYAAVRNGSVSAAMLADPGNFQALDQGFSNLGTLDQALPPMDFQGWTVSLSGARGSPEPLVAFLKGMVKTYQWLYDPANKAETLRFWQDEFKLEPKIAEQAYEVNIPGQMWNENGRINREAIAALLDDMRGNNVFEGLAVPTVDQLIDESYLQQAWEQLGIRR
jgi:ABC-type nitrate/sulfonate/bicarbonate transport system substrate-binding protein